MNVCVCVTHMYFGYMRNRISTIISSIILNSILYGMGFDNADNKQIQY